MKKTLKEIASLVDGELIGDGNIEISSVSGIREAQEGDITFLANPLYKPLLGITKASAVITSKDDAPVSKPTIRTDNPSMAFSKVVSAFQAQKQKELPTGINKSAIIGKNVVLGDNISIGPFVVIEDGSSIGDGTLVFPHTYIGSNSQIGANSKIYPNVTIRENAIIGNNVIIHSGTVVGSDGFGYVQIDDKYQKIPQAGKVVIEDDVEIGSNVSIDRARFGETVIGRGTKIDNLVQIAHNVKIGENAVIVSQSGIAGSSSLGKNVTVAGQVGITGHLKIGDNVIIAARSGVSKSLPAGSVVMGAPVKPMAEEKKILVSLKKLPEIVKTVSELKKKFLKDK
ncbi:UDP-3-O-(3-hydroxymyristoyl)glucosamine N-acyltransferase [Candidatus Omnitrophota bacterium]